MLHLFVAHSQANFDYWIHPNVLNLVNLLRLWDTAVYREVLIGNYNLCCPVLLLFLNWMYIRDFFLNFFSFFLIFMGEIAFTSILAVPFLCESAIWNNRMELGLRLGSGVGLEFRIIKTILNIYFYDYLKMFPFYQFIIT